MQPLTSKKRSPWAAVGCGLVKLLMLGMLVILVFKAAMFWIIYRERNAFDRARTDPQGVETRARKIVEWNELPEGYLLVGSASIPYLADHVFFSDELPPANVHVSLGDLNARFKERAFNFITTLHAGKPRELQDFVQGKGEQPGWPQVYADFEFGELVHRGSVEVNGLTIPYSANRGWFDFDGLGREGRDGIVTLLEVNCPDAIRVRMGVWFGPDPHKDKPLAKSDYTGTNADPKEIAAFASHFRFCPEAD